MSVPNKAANSQQLQISGHGSCIGHSDESAGMQEGGWVLERPDPYVQPERQALTRNRLRDALAARYSYVRKERRRLVRRLSLLFESGRDDSLSDHDRVQRLHLGSYNLPRAGWHLQHGRVLASGQFRHQDDLTVR
jgi:hypothetical protein